MTTEQFKKRIESKNEFDEQEKITSWFIAQQIQEEKFEIILDKNLEMDDYLGDAEVLNYLREIGQIPLLTKEEEVRLITELDNLKKQLKHNHITDEYLEEKLRKLGFIGQVKKDKTAININRQITYLTKLQEEKKIELELAQKDLKQNLSQTDETMLKQLEEIDKLIQDLNIALKYWNAFDKIWESNLRLVVSIARRYDPKGMELQDLIQEGSIGLRRAIENFDIRINNSFPIYATLLINIEITRAIAQKNYLIKIPTSFFELYNRVLNTFEKEFQRKPCNKELVFYIKETLKNKEKQYGRKFIKKEINTVIRLIQFMYQEPLSLNQTIGNDDDMDNIATLEEITPSKEKSPEELILIRFLEEEIGNLLSEINEKEAVILALKYGLDLKKYFDLSDLLIATTGIKIWIYGRYARTEEKERINALLVAWANGIDISMVASKEELTTISDFLKSTPLKIEDIQLQPSQKHTLKTLVEIYERGYFEKKYANGLNWYDIKKVFGIDFIDDRDKTIELMNLKKTLDRAESKVKRLARSYHLTD